MFFLRNIISSEQSILPPPKKNGSPGGRAETVGIGQGK